MLKIKNDLVLDHIYKNNKPKPISSGLLIKKAYPDGEIEIAHIYWDKSINNCYIKTVADNFQNNIVVYDDFKDFIYLVDAAYDYISTIYASINK